MKTETVVAGNDATPPAPPSRDGYIFTGWDKAYTNVQSDLTIIAQYEVATPTTYLVTINSGSSGGGGGATHYYYTITATATTNGKISPSGKTTFSEGSDKTFTITPNKGFEIKDVLLDGESIGAVESYTFKNIQKYHTIEAFF